MKCILLRHGIAVSQEEWEGQERERPLTRDGINKTRKAIEGLSHIEIQPTHLLSSPLRRALDTAQIMEEVFGLGEIIQVCQELISAQPPIDLFPVLSQLPEESCVICVGHEPHLGQLAAMMISGRYLPGLSLKKAGACAIQFEGKPQIGYGWLEWWMRPSHLRQLKNR
ncbi:MAG: SixA phosphatase family protein [Nitrospirales bacterium]